MFRELFIGGALGSPNRVFNARRTELPDANGYNGYVQLSKFVRDEDAPIVARMAFDPYALAEANYIYRSMVNNRANKKIRQHIPEARLPFTETRATMVVHGKKVRCGPEHFFLVYWIERCGGPFPFEEFEFERDNSGIKTTPSPRRANVNWPHPPEPEFKTVRPPAEEDVIRSDTDPSRMKKLVERLLAKKRFTDLVDKNWKKRPKKESKYKTPDVDEVFVPTAEPGEGSSTGPATGTEPVTPLTLITPVDGDEGGENPPEGGPDEGGAAVERAETLKGGFRLFMQIVTHFHKEVEGMACRVIEVPSRGQPVPRPAPSLFPTAIPGKRLGFSYMTLPNRQRRRRMVMVAEGVYRGRCFYLMEIEPQPKVPPKKPPKGRKNEGPTTFTLFVCYQGEQFTRLDGDDLRDVLAYCALHRGTWLTDKEMEGLGKHKVRHGSKSVARYVARIMEALEKGGLLL